MMRPFNILIFILLTTTAGISQDITGTVVILSDKIGQTIDLEERNLNKLFMGVRDYIDPGGVVLKEQPADSGSAPEKSIAQSLELSAVVPVFEEPAIIFRMSYYIGCIGIEPSLIMDKFGAYVLSATAILAFPFQCSVFYIRPFLGAGYGRFLPVNEGMVNFGLGVNVQFLESWGIRVECMGFTTFEAGYYGPSVGLFYRLLK